MNNISPSFPSSLPHSSIRASQAIKYTTNIQGNHMKQKGSSFRRTGSSHISDIHIEGKRHFYKKVRFGQKSCSQAGRHVIGKAFNRKSG